jgi:hypothetical protein
MIGEYRRMAAPPDPTNPLFGWELAHLRINAVL